MGEKSNTKFDTGIGNMSKSRSNFSTGGGNMTDEQWERMLHQDNREIQNLECNSDKKNEIVIDKALELLRNHSINKVLKLTPIVKEKVKVIQEIAQCLGIVQLESEYLAYELYKAFLVKGYFLNKKEEFLL